MVFTTRLSGGKGGRNAFEHELRALGVIQKNSRPNHLTTCGKVERFQQTLKKWLRAQPVQPTTVAELQTLIDTFVEVYNHHRPHRSFPPGHSGHDLHQPPQGHSRRPQYRHPRPTPPRPDRHQRQDHPSPPRPASLHRHRPHPLLDSLPRLTEADIAELHETQEAIEATADVEEFLVLERKLHWISYRGHQTTLLATMVQRLWDTTQHYRREFIRLSGGSSSWVTNSEHRLLIEAIERRDTSTAEDVLALHIRRTRVELRKHPELFRNP